MMVCPKCGGHGSLGDGVREPVVKCWRCDGKGECRIPPEPPDTHEVAELKQALKYDRDCLEQAVADMFSARLDRDELLAMLRELEWSGRVPNTHDDLGCPECGAEKCDETHKPGCRLDALLRRYKR